MTDFKDKILLYEELIKREVEHYCLCNPNLVNAMQAASWNHAPNKVKELFGVIYGKDETDNFLNEYNKRKEALK